MGSQSPGLPSHLRFCDFSQQSRFTTACRCLKKLALPSIFWQKSSILDDVNERMGHVWGVKTYYDPSYIFPWGQDPKIYVPLKICTVNNSFYLPFLTQVFHPWWCETWRVIQQQSWMKEFAIFRGGGQYILWPHTIFRGQHPHPEDLCPWALIYQQTFSFVTTDNF